MKRLLAVIALAAGFAFAGVAQAQDKPAAAPAADKPAAAIEAPAATAPAAAPAAAPAPKVDKGDTTWM
ncbi:MAG TPA: hypothetical protein VI730_06975, partial [Burkholderiales bacterium]|nr:hypothetical protein [Burkholderiales bacterium]